MVILLEQGHLILGMLLVLKKLQVIMSISKLPTLGL